MLREDLKFLLDPLVTELADLSEKRKMLVSKMNAICKDFNYSERSYDESSKANMMLEEIAIMADISFAGHKPGLKNTFWIASSEIY